MTTVYLAPDPINSTQFIPGGNVPAAGAQLFCYRAGSSTKQDMFTDISGTTKWTNPLILDSGGNLGGSNEIWIPAGLPAKFVLAPSNDTDPPVSPYWSRDNLPGVNDPSQVQSEWIPSGLTPTFVNGSTFVLGGDQTTTVTVGRRLRTVNTAGTFYSSASSSVFAVSTTIGIISDTTGIDSGLSAVSYGILNEINVSIPAFIQSGAGATPRLLQSKLRDSVSVKDFGAKGDGVTDDTAAFQAVALIGGRIYAPKPSVSYLITDTILFAQQRTTIYGDGQQSTIIKFAPTATGKPCFHFKQAAASTIAQSGVQGIAFDATGNTQGTKTAIRITDGEEIILRDIAVSNWSSAGHDCIGLQTRGRQTHDISDLTINADIPISIETNPNSTLSIDHYHFWNCYLLATANPCIVIADGVNLSNVTFDGYQAWVGGTYGLFWNDTTSAAVSLNLTIKNVRTEQGTSATAYMISITHNFALQNLIIENIYGGADRRGFFFRKVQFWHIKDSVYTSTTSEALNIDNTTQFGKGSQNFWQTGATASISGLTKIYQWGVAVNSSLASEFLYLNTGTFSQAQTVLNGTISLPTDIPLLLTNQTNAAGASTATLTNSPHLGNPVFWPKISVNGSTLCFPAFQTS